MTGRRLVSTGNLAAILAAIVLVGCLDLTTTAPSAAPGPEFAARVIIQEGSSQIGPVARALPVPITVKVTDAGGTAVVGAAVSFSVRQGGGSVASPTTVSAAGGVSSTLWTLGSKQGTQQVVAILSSAFVLDSVVFSATAINGPAAIIVISAGDVQTGVVAATLVTPLAARVLDDFGNSVPGAPVTWAVTLGGGLVTVVQQTTDSTGRASATWRLGTVAGQQTVSAAIATGAAVSFRANAVGGAVAQLIQESGSGQSGPVGKALDALLSVRVVDGFGNGVRGAAVSFGGGPDDGSIAAIGSGTDSLGRIQARWTLGLKTGLQTSVASVPGTASSTFAATATASAPVSATIETGSNQTQAVRQTLPLPLVVRVADTYGNPVSGTAVTWAIAGGGGSILTTLPTTDVTGRSTAIWTMGSTTGSQLATFKISTLPLIVFSAIATAGLADTLAIVTGNSQTGIVLTVLGTALIVRLVDASGNPIVGASVVFAVVSGGGSVGPTVATTDGAGRAIAVWTLGSFAGAQTVTATSGSKTVTFVATGAAAGGGGGGGSLTPAQIVLVSGNGQTGSVGQPLGSPVVVRVIDAAGTPVSGKNVAWTLSVANSGGFASPSVSATDGSGLATVLWNLGSKIGLQQITANVTGVPAVTLQATAQINSGGALLIDNGDAQSAAVGALLPKYLRVLVLDQSGQPVVGARVVWSTTTGNGLLSKATGLTDAFGQDSVVWALGTTVGPQTATASVTGLASVTFRATASTGGAPASTPASIVKISGDGQTAISGKLLPTPLVVEVRDAAGTPLASVPVTFGPPLNGGFVAPASATTGTDGRVSVSWTLASNTGTTVQTDSVSVVVGVLAAVKFYATVRPALRIRWTLGGTSAASPLMADTTGTTLKDTLEVQVYDPTGGATLGVAGQSITWRTLAPDSIDGLAVNSVITTDNNGRARNRWVLRGKSGLAIPASGIAKRMVATSAEIGEVEFQARVYPGSICAVSLSVGGSPVVGTSVASTATVSDCNGFRIPGASVAFSVASGSVAPTPVITNSSGLALTTWTYFTLPGVQTLSATASGKAAPYIAGGDASYSASVSIAQTVVAGAPAVVTVVGVPPLTKTVGTTVTITVTITDSFGNLVPTTTVLFAASGGGVSPATPGFVSSAVATTGAGGAASVVWTMGSAAVLNTLTITAGGAVTSVSITGTP